MVQPKDKSDNDSLAQLVDLFINTFQEIHRAGIGDELVIMNESGLTMPQLITLHILQTSGIKTVSEIAHCTNLSRAATSHLIDRLVRMRLVERTEDEEDRRQKKITINHAGNKLVDQLHHARRKQLGKAFQYLSQETRLAMTKSLKQTLSEISNHSKNQHDSSGGNDDQK